MIRWALQRLVRLSPRAGRIAWQALPGKARDLLSPLVYPIAAGSRQGAQPLVVDRPAAPARYAVVIAPEAAVDPARVQRLLELGHRVVELGSRTPEEVARKEQLLDAVLVVGSGAEPPDVTRLGWRVARPGQDLDSTFPETTIVVPTHAARELCRTCLHSLVRFTGFGGWRVVVVDDASSDGTADMLAEMAKGEPRLEVVRLERQHGFAKACNAGLALATGELVVLLNDDTVVAPGWLARLVAHLERDPRILLACPVTNQIGNAARIDTDYTDLDGMARLARERAFTYAGQCFDIQSIALFCAIARRETLEAVGGLDERYEVGMFEDDDLSMTLRARGARLVVARDAFVHHVGHATFGKLGDRQYLSIWEANKRRFEQKWGRRWAPPEP